MRFLPNGVSWSLLAAARGKWFGNARRGILSPLFFAALATVILLPLRSDAAAYASGLTNNSGAISFYLNEPAYDVKIISAASSVTNDLGPVNKGKFTTANLGVSGVYSVSVVSTATTGYAQTSSDTNTFINFVRPNGVAVNTRPSSPYFGRIYVANANTTATTLGRTQGRGIYALNADQSDGLGQGNTALNAGIAWASSTSDPYKLSVGPDDRLYIGGFANADANIWSVNQTITSFSAIFSPSGISSPMIHTDFAASPIVTGTQAGSTLAIYCVDGQLTNSSGATAWNSICRWNVGSGPLPWTTGPTILGNTGITTTADLANDMDMGPDGKIYGLVYRSAGTDVDSLFVFDTNTPANKLWGSLSNLGNPDPLHSARAVAVSVDGSKLALIHDDNHVSLMRLTNGVPDYSSLLIITNSPVTASGRDVAFDVAGNIYTISSGQQFLRVWSVGGTWLANTGSGGTFSIAPTVIITNNPFYQLYDAGPGFVSGENLILTNLAGLGLSVWSSTRGAQSITAWNLEGAMGETSLNDGSGKSRYSLNVNPSVSPTYYVVSKVNAGPYSNAIPVAWITSDGNGNFAVFNTNAAINASGILNLPVPPDISQQPVGRTVLAGKNCTFSSSASSYSAIGYRWYYSATVGLGNYSTNSTLLLTNVTQANSGSYNVVVTNFYGSATSSVVSLTVLPPPRLSGQTATNGLQFYGTGVPGDAYWVQSASNLNFPVPWITAWTNVVGQDGSVQFTATNAAAQPNRFYRILFP